MTEKLFSPHILNLPVFPSSPSNANVRLNANESPYTENISSEILSNESLNRYPDPYACALREDIGKMLGFDKDWIMMGNGSDEVISILISTFARTGGKICFPVPTFPMYQVVAACSRQACLEIPLTPDFDIDFRQFKKSIENEKPALIIFAFPNNPTGNCFNSEAISKIIDDAECPVVVDEAYYEFSKKTFISKLRENKKLLIVRTFSKIGFAGIRLGYLIGNPEMISVIQKVKLPFNVNRITQAIGREIVKNKKEIDKKAALIIEERKRIFRKLTENPLVNPIPSDANFIMFKPDFSCEDFYTYLQAEGIFIKALKGSLSNYMRVTVGTKEENDVFLKSLSNFSASV